MQIKAFFNDYKKLEKKDVIVLEFGNRAKAFKIINDAIELYHETFDSVA